MSGSLHPEPHPSLVSTLRHYGLAPGALIGRGMEAAAYAYGAERVLKIYAGTARADELRQLAAFYRSLGAGRLSYALPLIEALVERDGCLVAVERRLPGAPLAELLPGLAGAELEDTMRVYLAAQLELRALRAPPDLGRYRLFDPQGLSARRDGDWNAFLLRLLRHKLAALTPHLRRDVSDFEAKLARLAQTLARPYGGDYTLIHGDFFPGNLLVDAGRRPVGLLDFGLLTMYGDALFDIATGWAFFDMYDELRANARERYLAIVLSALGEGARGALYRYLLLYSVVGANAYSPECADGHYRWCVANLNDPAYWLDLA